MAASFVLIHSPSVGPRTWQPVADRLAELGWEAAVPSLLHVADEGSPFWPRVVDAVRAGLGTVRQDQGVVLVAHSNAGLFIPVITTALAGQVLGCIFVDAALPPASGAAPVAPPELLALLRDKASGGLLPRWTDWWDEKEVAPLFPDQQTRQAVTEEQPRLPLSYYEASVPVPAGWEAHHAPTCCSVRPMTSWPPRRAGGAGSSGSFQERISTSWSTPTVSPACCWRSSNRWASPGLEQQCVMERNWCPGSGGVAAGPAGMGAGGDSRLARWLHRPGRPGAAAGCWRFELSWSGHADQVYVPYQPAAGGVAG